MRLGWGREAPPPLPVPDRPAATEEHAMAGKGKPSKGTPKDMRLKANQPKKAAALKFGSPAWRAKYGK
jgi:hypothetical protein